MWSFLVDGILLYTTSQTQASSILQTHLFLESHDTLHSKEDKMKQRKYYTHDEQRDLVETRLASESFVRKDFRDA